MSIFSKLFGGGSSVDEEIQKACNSDQFDIIADMINGDKVKLAKSLNYLTEKDNLSMKLRVMTFTMFALMVSLLWIF